MSLYESTHGAQERGSVLQRLPILLLRARAWGIDLLFVMRVGLETL